MNVSDAAHINTWQKYIICIWCKVLIKFQQFLIKVLSRTYWNISRYTLAKLTLRKKIRKCLLFTNSPPKIEILFFFWTWWNAFFSLIILGFSEIRVVSFLLFCAYLRDLQLQHILRHFFYLQYFDIFHFVHILSIRNTIFSNTLSFFLIFIIIRKIKHALNWKTLFDRNIFITFIMSFQITRSWYIICRQTGSKYTWPLYLRTRFNLTKINPMETAGFEHYKYFL